MIRVLALLAALLAPGPAFGADAFPSRPIEFVTQSSIGGGGDVMARQIIEATKDLVPQPMVVVNKPGAGGRNLENYVKDKKPDGHTLIVTTATSVLWYYTGALTFSVNKDLEPIIRLQVEPNLIAVRANAPWKTIKELVADAKAGKVTFGGGPVGGAEYLFFYKLAKDQGFKLSYVAYGGGGEAGTSLLGGNIDATFLQASESLDHVRSGGIRYLGVASAKRVADVPELKDIPTLREDGVDFVFEHWRGIHAPAGTPPGVVEYLHARFKEGQSRESWRKWLKDTAQLGGYLSPTDFRAFTIEQDRLIEQITTDAGLNKKKK